MEFTMTEPNCTLAPIVVIKITWTKPWASEIVDVIDGLELAQRSGIANGEKYIVLRNDISIQSKGAVGKDGIVIIKIEYETNGAMMPAPKIVQDAAREDAKGIIESLKLALSVLE